DVSATASATATIDRTFGYTIEYAYAGTVDATATVNATAQYGDVIANVLDAVSVGDARHPGKPQAGYAFEKVTIPAGGHQDPRQPDPRGLPAPVPDGGGYEDLGGREQRVWDAADVGDG
ncbi:MAG: hypothetical protein RSA12_04240, partial [Clostridia bacterium]